MSKKRKSVKSNESTLIRCSYAGICIAISLIALFYQYCNTGLLGALLCNCARYLFGNIWFVLYLILLAYGIFLFLGRKVTVSRYFVTFGLLFAVGLMICAMPEDKSLTGNAIFDEFFTNSKDIFAGDYDAKGGLIGCILYGMFSYFVSFFGTVIIMAAFTLIAIFIAVGDVDLDSFFDKLKQKREVAKKKKASAKVIKQKDRESKAKSPFVEMGIKKKEEKKENRKTVKEVEPIIKSEEIKRKPYIEEEVEQLELPIEKTLKTSIVKQNTAPISTVSSSSSTEKGNANLGIYNEKNYKLPKNILLEPVTVSKKNVNQKNAVEKWQELEEILESFGLPSSLSTYNIGPSVTQFEIVPEGNFNIRKYSSIEENIKMQLAVRDVRIEAPIPGKKAVGIEIPNIERTPVRLRELLNDVPSDFQNQPLMMALGKDLSGEGVYGRIDKMPHLLIAGATGSGKSVCINSIILTLLMRTRPDQVKLLMIDPKKVEFTPYESIPHLVCPIINDTTKAAESLKNLVALMEQRYNDFARTGCRNISEYNKKNPDHMMCNIVCIIDELADLMMTHGKEVEQYIARLAAMARASGIFMILATQRPSTDVITGTIKNNIVSRIAFAVSSSYDSRTIIDRVGAEALFGNGDMLYMPSGVSSPIRVQGVYVSDEEISNVVNYLKESNYIPHYEDIFMVDPDAEDNNLVGASCEDPLYAEIKKWVMTQKTISASGLQRRCGLGFPRAAKIIDALEQDGIISGANGSKPRDVLVQLENQE